MEYNPNPGADGVHETGAETTQPGESTTPVTPPAEPTTAPAAEPTAPGTPVEPTPPAAPAAPPAPAVPAETAAAPIAEDAERVEGDLAPPDVQISPTETDQGLNVDNQMADPTGLPPESFEADPSDDRSLPHEQDQA